MKLGKREKAPLIKKRSGGRGTGPEKHSEPLRASIDDYTDEELELLPARKIAQLPECVVRLSLLSRRITQGMNRRAAATTPKADKRWGKHYD